MIQHSFLFAVFQKTGKPTEFDTCPETEVWLDDLETEVGDEGLGRARSRRDYTQNIIVQRICALVI